MARRRAGAMRFTRKNSASSRLLPTRNAALPEVRRIEDQLTQVVARASASSTPRHSGRLLGTLLVTRGYLVPGELEFVLKRQAETGQRLGDLLLELGLVDEQALMELV